jgi:thiamine-phosphate pyrophosphorylase
METTKVRIARLHYITQEMEGYTHSELAEDACRGGVEWVQLRIKGKSFDETLSIAKEVKKICGHYHAAFIINDHVDIAKEVGAHGIHLGKEDKSVEEARKVLGDNYIIGGTANTIEDIKRLAAMNVDYIGLGPFRFTTTKEKLSPVLGLEGFRDICVQTSNVKPLYVPPLIAIGGIKFEDISTLMQTGIYGVAVSSGINKATDRAKAATGNLNKLKISYFKNDI